MARHDILIRNGKVIDGTGKPPLGAEVAIRGDRIVDVGPNLGEADHVIDAKGKVVAPGFIDPHAHLELLLLLQPDSSEYVAQGITTAVNGNCGHSVTPYESKRVLEYHYRNGLISIDFRNKAGGRSWKDLSGYIQAVKDNGGTAINHATLLGHGTLRWSVMGGALDRPPTEEENKELERLVAEGMEQGAVGMSTGLAYIPSRYATTEEIVDLTRTVAKYNGVYASHIRYYLGIEEATREAIEIGRRSGARVQVSHLHMGEVGAYKAIDEARAAGQPVLADTIPQSTGHLVRGDRLIQFIMTMTPELFDVGVEGVLEAIKTLEGRKRIAQVEPFFSHDPNDVYIVNTGDEKVEARTVADVAAEKGLTPQDLMFDLLLERETGVTFWFGRNRKDTGTDFPPAEVIQYPWMGPGSDVLMVEQSDPTGWYELMRPGCIVHFFRQARARGVSVEEIIRRMTSMPAEHFRLQDRGVLKKGAFADVVVFDPDELYYPSRDEVDYRTSRHLVKGMDRVIVNGVIVLENDVQNDRRPGRMLRRG
ncbi:MAG: amidohydrolase family protein [Bacillota bacterium]